MEYAEEDEPDQAMEESKLEAHANIPNIPMPRSSDGNVSVIYDVKTSWVPTNLAMPSHSIG